MSRRERKGPAAAAGVSEPPAAAVAAERSRGNGDGTPGAAPASQARADVAVAPAAAPEAAVTPESRQTVTIKLARFEGPLDLLLHLIKRDEIDIYDIPIAHITQQYLGYLELMRILDLEVAGEFLVMAATLMRIKAKMLLPLPGVGDEEEDEGDPREELVQRLIEYRQFKEAAGTLREREGERRLLHERGQIPGEDEMGPLPLAPATLFDLLDALNRVMSRLPESSVYEVQGEVFDLEDKMSLIASLAAEQGRLSFEALLLRCRVRLEMIVTFIALLELIKLGRIEVVQTEEFGPIEIVYRSTEGSDSHAAREAPVRD